MSPTVRLICARQREDADIRTGVFALEGDAVDRIGLHRDPAAVNHQSSLFIILLRGHLQSRAAVHTNARPIAAGIGIIRCFQHIGLPVQRHSAVGILQLKIEVFRMLQLAECDGTQLRAALGDIADPHILRSGRYDEVAICVSLGIVSPLVKGQPQRTATALGPHPIDRTTGHIVAREVAEDWLPKVIFPSAAE